MHEARIRETGQHKNLHVRSIVDLIESFMHLKVLVIGDAIADIYIKVVPEKICREAPVLVFSVTDKEYHCGGQLM